MTAYPAFAASRRSLLAAGLAAATPLRAAAAVLAASPQSARFQVWRNGGQIGEHSVSVVDAGGEQVATITAHFIVSVGPIPVFRYRHAATETWRDGRFASLEAHSVANGRPTLVRASRTPLGVSIQIDDGAPVLAAADATPLTHWNMKGLSGPLFNPQSGKLMARERVQPLGPTPVMLANGRTIDAHAYALSGEAQITDWYDTAGAWTGLRAKVIDGSFVDYRRLG